MNDAVFSYVLAHTLESEGLFSDDAADSGGATMYGITESVARKNGYDGDMRDLPLEKAKEIYHRQYWVEPGYDRVAEQDIELAQELFGRPAGLESLHRGHQGSIRRSDATG